MTEKIKHSVNIRKKRLTEALETMVMINRNMILEDYYGGVVNKQAVNVKAVTDKDVIYEEVIEEVVYDDILLYDGGIEEAIAEKQAEAMKANSIKVEAIIAEIKKTRDMSAEEITVESVKAEVTQNKVIIGDGGLDAATAAEESKVLNAGPVQAEFRKAEANNAISTNTEAIQNEVMTDEAIAAKKAKIIEAYKIKVADIIDKCKAKKSESMNNEPICVEDLIAELNKANTMTADEIIAEATQNEAMTDEDGVNGAITPEKNNIESYFDENLLAEYKKFNTMHTKAMKVDFMEGKYMQYTFMTDECDIAELNTAKKARYRNAGDIHAAAMQTKAVIEEIRKSNARKAKSNNVVSMKTDSMQHEVMTDETVTSESMSDDEATFPIYGDRTTDIDAYMDEYYEFHLSLLEDWEDCKLDILEHMVKDVQELQELHYELEDLLDELSEQDTEMEEDDLLEFSKNDLEEDPSFDPLDELEEQQQPRTPKRQDHPKKRYKISATSTPIKRQPGKAEIVDKFQANEDGLVVIGSNGTTIAKSALAAINWSLSGAALTRKILMEVFDRETLAFHTLTGKPSPAFLDCDKPMKNQLDPLKVADIMQFVMEHAELTAKEVRNAITTKCADENKMHRQREKKKQNAALKQQQKKG